MTQTSTPRASAEFFKGHGLGNDYFVVEVGTDWKMSPGNIAAVCDRWRGPGSDGIVVLLDRAGPPFRLRMFNPDGSEFERSGNGLRILGSYLAAEGLVGGEPFDIEVGGDTVRLHVLGLRDGGEYDVSVDMGRVGFGPVAVGLDPEALDGAGAIDLGEAGAQVLELVSVGNPHAVFFPEVWAPEQLDEIGPLLSTHPAFASGTNVQMARVVGPGVVEARIWERGVGPTSASGTSSCAVAAATVSSGRGEAGEYEVRMEGGSLQVTVSPQDDVTLGGPVQEICRGRLTLGFLEGLEALPPGRPGPGGV
jgi:diaminopimelate epimerase